MKILCFSDWQKNLNGDFLLSILNKLGERDFLVFAGDGILGFLSEKYDYKFSEGIKNYVKRFLGKDFINQLVKYPKIGFLYVEGNDDPEVDLGFLGGIRLSGKIFKCKLNFLGLEGSPGPIRGLTRKEEGYYYEILKRASEIGEKYILVSHSPPYGILDRTPRGLNVGSKALREFIEKNDRLFPLVLCGHVHNWGGKWVKFGKSYIVNCAMSVVEVELVGWEVKGVRVIF